jgi:hypothetical protein
MFLSFPRNFYYHFTYIAPADGTSPRLHITLGSLCLVAVATANGNESDGSEIVFLMATDAFIPVSGLHQQKIQ